MRERAGQLSMGLLVIAVVSVVIGVGFFPVINGVVDIVSQFTFEKSTESDFSDGTFVNTTANGGILTIVPNNETGTYSQTTTVPTQEFSEAVIDASIPANTGANATLSVGAESSTVQLVDGQNEVDMSSFSGTEVGFDTSLRGFVETENAPNDPDSLLSLFTFDEEDSYLGQGQQFDVVRQQNFSFNVFNVEQAPVGIEGESLRLDSDQGALNAEWGNFSEMDSFTWIFYINMTKPSGTGSDEMIRLSSPGSSFEMELFSNDDDTFSANAICEEGSVQLSDFDQSQPNNGDELWQAAFTWETGVANFYIDGNSPQFFGNEGCTMQSGSDIPNARLDFDVERGFLDEMMFYENRALSSAELSALADDTRSEQVTNTTYPSVNSYEVSGTKQGTDSQLMSLIGTLFIIGVVFGALRMLGIFQRFES